MSFGPLFWIVGLVAFVGIAKSAPARAWEGGGAGVILMVMVVGAVVALVHDAGRR